MQARMKNPAMIVPDAMQALQGFAAAVHQGGVPQRTLGLVHLRVSQINGCSVCVDGGVRGARKSGETDERLFAEREWAAGMERRSPRGCYGVAASRVGT